MRGCGFTNTERADGASRDQSIGRQSRQIARRDARNELRRKELEKAAQLPAQDSGVPRKK